MVLIMGTPKRGTLILGNYHIGDYTEDYCRGSLEDGSFYNSCLPYWWLVANVGNMIPIWGFPKIRGTILGVLIIRTIIFWGLYWLFREITI